MCSVVVGCSVPEMPLGSNAFISIVQICISVVILFVHLLYQLLKEGGFKHLCYDCESVCLFVYFLLDFTYFESLLFGVYV